MPFPLLVPGALAAIASGTTAGAGVAAGTATVGTGTAIVAGAAGSGGLASMWIFIKHLFVHWKCSWNRGCRSWNRRCCKSIFSKSGYGKSGCSKSGSW